jgi:hypothetical protein
MVIVRKKETLETSNKRREGNKRWSNGTSNCKKKGNPGNRQQEEEKEQEVEQW